MARAKRKKSGATFGSRTDVGCVREHNEDSYLVKSPLFVVADGMGGHEAGEVASKIAVTTMEAHAPKSTSPEALGAAVVKANEAVLRGAKDGTGKPGMGTTLTAAFVYEDEAVIAQVGDSRAYLLHNDQLQRITRDHSLVADLIEQGRLTEAEARFHPQRSVITRALGSDPNMQPDLYTLHVEEGDRLVLCSDGLCSMISDGEIEEILLDNPTPAQACDALVEEALIAGGLDNVTVIVIDPLGDPPSDDEEVTYVEERVVGELRDLSMPSVRFEVRLLSREGKNALSASGADEVSFVMSANAGEALGPISRIASGGELSRIMLALKNVFAEKDGVDALIFDEIDTGVSGVAAQRVAEKLASLGRTKQVLCVTHLPQIAAMAQQQYLVEKAEHGGRTYTNIRLLDREGRRYELARLSGGDMITDIQLAGAEELLARDERFRASLS